MASLSESANAVAADPESRLVWLILVGAVATLVAIAVAFRSQ